MIKVSEYFYSIQGEGPGTGIPSYIIRLSGCPHKCDSCDSKFSWDKNYGEDLKEVIKKLDIPEQCNTVIISGGEPTIHFDDNDFKLLVEKLAGKNIEIETTALPDKSLLEWSDIFKTLYGYNGFSSKIRKFKKDAYPIKFIVSPKLEDENINNAIKYYNISDHNSWNFVYKLIYFSEDESIIKRFIYDGIKDPYFRKNKLFIMPFTPVLQNISLNEFRDIYNTSCRETIRFCKKHGLRYTPRIHIDVYGMERGV